MPPISMMKIDSTLAKIGRSMKKWESRIAVSPSARPVRPRLDLAGLRRHLRSRPRPQQAVDDDAVVGAEAVAHDAPAEPAPARPETGRTACTARVGPAGSITGGSAP